MDTKTFNEHYELDRKSKTARAVPKGAAIEPVEVMTADGVPYDRNATYYFFDAQSADVRTSAGLRRDGEYLCTFGLRVIEISKLRASRNDALADGQAFFKSEIERINKRIADYELEKTTEARSLKAFLMAKE